MKARIFVSGLSCVVLMGCAFTERDHLATTNWMDRTIVPDNRAAQWAMTPLLVPLCVATMTVDNLIVAPAAHLPCALDDAHNWFTEEVGGYYTEMGILPIRTALTPAVFVGSWSVRSVFAIKIDEGWGWPEWGRLWVRDENGRLLGPSTQYHRKTKKPIGEIE